MKRSKLFYYAAALCMSSGLLFTSCSDDDNKVPTRPEENKPDKGDNDKDENKRVTTDEQYYANNFAYDILDYYYYWNEEIASDLKKLDPNKNTDPIETVSEIKYHQGGKAIDKWTMLTDDMKKFQSGVAGVSTTYGYQPITYRMREGSNECISAIAYVYKNSPAAKAGLKRGDLIYQINGKQLTTENFRDLFNTSSITVSLAALKMGPNGQGTLSPTGKEVTMQAVEMYEDPILLDSIYEVNGKKVGYLAYASFDLASIPNLIEVSKKFKKEGVKELILDFRYNGGGYVITESAMASMYAPQSAVEAGEIFEIEKYNKQLTKEMEEQGESSKTPFKTEFNFKDQSGQAHSYSTKDANIGIEKVYGLITQNSASASEALLSGLMPYVNVELLGEPSHGKYCTGWMVAAKDAYKQVPQPIANWGIYVMVSIYQNAKGETPCMPDGLQPQHQAIDDPMLPTQLGDINENMLKVALQRAGKVYEDKGTKSRAGMGTFQVVDTPHKANFGKRILLPSQLPSLSE